MAEPWLKALLQGDPGTAKTGSLASLVGAGYRVILADFDGNPEPLLAHVPADKRGNVLVVPFADTLSVDSEGAISRSGSSACRAFTRFLSRGTAETGPPKEWGRETVLVLDSLSAFADSAERLALELNRGVTRDGAHIGVLAGEIETALSLMMGRQLQCHRVVVAHLKLIAPRPESSYGTETDLQKQIKREIAALQETAYFPNIPGMAVARTLARFFNTALLFETDRKGRRVIRTTPVTGYTIKCPVPVADPLPIETGMLTLMQAFAIVFGGER